MNRKLLFFTFIFILPGFFAHASVVITEIMYDVEGADAGREWAEIQNTGPSLDLTGWKFFENGVNHGLVLAQGNIFIPQNGFAIIADNPEKFFLDWPDFKGTIFDSSFSFSNSGETFILRDAGLGDQDSVTYLSDVGGGGDGKSLQKNDSEWVSALPTPGKESTSSNTTEEINNNNEDNELEEISISIPEPKPSPFQAFAGKDRLALAGAEVYFEGQVEGLNEDMIFKARFLWNFGDGTIGEGKNIKHNFLYPGNYIVNLDISFGAYTSSDSVKITVSTAGITVSEIKPGNYIEIKNDASKISDVSGFGIQVNDSKIFSFLKDSMISPNSYLALDALALGFEILDSGEIKILYPNGKVFFSSKYQIGILRENESINFERNSWIKGEATPGAKNKITVISKTESSNIVSAPREDKLKPESVQDFKEASVINSTTSASFWSEIKWLVFGLAAGVLIGAAYLFIKHRIRYSVYP